MANQLLHNIKQEPNIDIDIDRGYDDYSQSSMSTSQFAYEEPKFIVCEYNENQIQKGLLTDPLNTESEDDNFYTADVENQININSRIPQFFLCSIRMCTFSTNSKRVFDSHRKLHKNKKIRKQIVASRYREKIKMNSEKWKNFKEKEKQRVKLYRQKIKLDKKKIVVRKKTTDEQKRKARDRQRKFREKKKMMLDNNIQKT